MKFFQDLAAYLVKRGASKNIQEINLDEQVGDLRKTLDALLSIIESENSEYSIKHKELILMLKEQLEDYVDKVNDDSIYHYVASFSNGCLDLFINKRDRREFEFNNPAHFLFYSIFIDKGENRTHDSEFDKQVVGSPGFIRYYMDQIGEPIDDDKFNQCMKEQPILYIIIVIGLYHLSGFKPKETEIKSTKELDDWTDSQASSDKGEVWYRGQSSASWGLIPSCHRGVNRFNDTVLVTDEIINNWYKDYKIDQKLAGTSFKDLKNRDKYIFLQHAISFSPLIDFTSDIYSALSFSMSNHTNYHEFENTDAAIYVLRLKDNCTVNPNVIKTLNILMNTNSRWTLSDIVYYAYGMIINPEVVVFDSGDNDRMKYQYGKLLMINNVVVLDNEYDLSRLLRHFHIEKLVIKAKVKRDLLKDVESLSKEKSLQNLMDPYNFLNIR